MPCGGAWLSLVERLLWEQDVGGSNPLAPTTHRIVLEQRCKLTGKRIDGERSDLQASKNSNAIRRTDA